MRHETGLQNFDTPLKPEDTLVENIKANKIGEVIEKQTPIIPKTPEMAKNSGLPWKRNYHAITRGWVANEIVRRVHPDKLTIGEILQREVSDKLQVKFS